MGSTITNILTFFFGAMIWDLVKWIFRPKVPLVEALPEDQWTCVGTNCGRVVYPEKGCPEHGFHMRNGTCVRIGRPAPLDPNWKL